MKTFEQWQKDLVGKNQHSVYSRCPDCLQMGINMPLDRVCGNCGKDNCVTYYDEETIHKYLHSREEELLREGWEARGERKMGPLDDRGYTQMENQYTYFEDFMQQRGKK